jgi:hypothetical protein
MTDTNEETIMSDTNEETGGETPAKKKSRAKKGGAKKAGAKKAVKKAVKKAAAKKAVRAQRASKKAAAPKAERRFTQSDAVVGAIKRLTRKGGGAETAKIYASAVDNNAELFANTKDPKATIRCILQRDKRVQRVLEDGTPSAAGKHWALVPEAEAASAEAGEVAEKPKRASRAKKAASAGEGGEAAPAKRRGGRRKKSEQAEDGSGGASDTTVDLDPQAVAEAEASE